MLNIEKGWVIDDDPITALIAKFALKKVFTQSDVQTFGNGVPALELLHQVAETGEKLPDVIFLDIKMPHMNGFEFLEKIFLQITPTPITKVYIYSNAITPQQIEQARSSRFPISGIILKPLTKEKLAQLIENHPFIIGNVPLQLQ